jgi:formylglycine-generating enzyme
MSKAVRLFHLVACAVGLAACGYPALPDLGGGGVSDASSSDAAPPPQFLSCAGLARTCGASGTDTCCNSPPIPGGMYHRSYDVNGDASSGTLNFPATLSDFRLDKYEVTVGRFRAFVNAGMGTQASPPLPGAGAHAKLAGSGWDAAWNANLATDKVALSAALKCDPTYVTWTDAPGANESRPLNCLTWYEAMAFCAWDGGYLPTEAEWNYAATGGDQQRAYPWSNPPGSLTLDSSHASYYGIMSGSTTCVGDGVFGCTVADMVVVGSKPLGEGRWGQSDLEGNLWELTLDWFAPYAASCTDCANLTAASSRVDRGAGYDFDAAMVRTGTRDSRAPQSRNTNVGARCARAP